MKKQFKYILSLSLFLVTWSMTIYSYSQDQAGKNTLDAVVNTEDGQPVTGALVSTQDGYLSTYTDIEGRFKLEVGSTDLIRVEKEGYDVIYLSANDLLANNKVTLKSVPFHTAQEDIVNMPFGKTNKRRIVGAVSSVKSSDVLGGDARQGITAHLNGRILSTRGIGTPIVVIDGIPRTNIGDLTMMEIEEVTVLQDATARALYGARADGGVILITTKRGTAQKRELNALVETGFSKAVSLPNYLDAPTYLEYLNVAQTSSGLDPIYTPEFINGVRDGSISYVPNEDYFSDRYIRDNLPFTSIITEMSSGNDNASFYLNTSYMNTGSLLAVDELGDGKKVGTDKFKIHANTDFKVNDKISGRVDVLFNLENKVGPQTDFWDQASKRNPTDSRVFIPLSSLPDSLQESAYVIDGQYVLGGSEQFRDNLYGDMYIKGYDEYWYRNGQVNAGLDFDLSELTEGLSATGYMTFNLRNTSTIRSTNQYAVYEENMVPDELTGESSLEYTKVGEDQFTRTQTETNLAFIRRIGYYGTLNYDRTFNDRHAVSATGLAYATRTDFNGSPQGLRDVHFALRTNYMLDNKYVAELSVTRLASVNLSPENRWGTSFAGGLGWVLSEESFLKNNSVVNYMKLRASAGLLKTDLLNGVNQYQTIFSEGFKYNYGPDQSGFGNNKIEIENIENPNLTFATRKEFNIGLDASLFNNSLYVDVNYFNTSLTDIPVAVDGIYPSYLGGFTIVQNYEEYNHSGLELTLNYEKSLGAVKLNAGGTFRYILPKNVKVDEPNYPEELSYLKRSGEIRDGIRGFVFEKYFETQEEIDNSPTQFGSLLPGDLKYKDVNNDGKIDNNDKVVIGNSSPRTRMAFNLGVEYKGLELQAIGSLQMGGQAQFRNGYIYPSLGDKYSEYVKDTWTPDNTDASLPRLSTVYSNNNNQVSSFWLKSTDHFRLDVVQLTYHFPQSIAQKLKMQGFDVYARASNLLAVGENIDLIDLRIGSAPKTRSFAVGLKTSF
ncbi:SusC/RagA family TonB-linked outer membrane protein [Sediminitomix flava]|uniref:TonB-linked SusC/RagA family outer membrane protein n=1 Tax=Sediminitomix flava TaxID=379075 RepID=A0A315YY72_SEDFL|nr:SusC/RagA family TonB-linked outer membrane protein [Sediminitomix flava]PWJ35013.1 TonB-linked SusC/RagA family outer membrane protein [Sediminitomix flava]